MSAAVAVPLLLAAALACALVLGRAVGRRRGRLAAGLSGLLAAVVVVGAGSQAWARTSLDRSTLARTLVWLEADVDDVRRFPSAALAAGSAPLVLRDGALPALLRAGPAGHRPAGAGLRGAGTALPLLELRPAAGRSGARARDRQ